jgi:hypothetical protein
MLRKEPCPDLRTIKPADGKSALVIGGTTSIKSGGIDTLHHLNKIFIGTVKGESFFTAVVDPGEYYLSVVRSKNAGLALAGVAGLAMYHGMDAKVDIIKLAMEPNKVIYVKEEIRLDFGTQGTNFELVESQNMYEEMHEKRCNYYEYNLNEAASDLTENEFNNRIALYNLRQPEVAAKKAKEEAEEAADKAKDAEKTAKKAKKLAKTAKESVDTSADKEFAKKAQEKAETVAENAEVAANKAKKEADEAAKKAAVAKNKADEVAKKVEEDANERAKEETKNKKR